MMTVPTERPRRPLARRLLVRLGVFGLGLSLLITALAIVVDYHLLRERVTERFGQIKVSYLSSVTENLWLQDVERLGQLVNGIQHLPYVQLVEVTGPDGAVLASAGARDDSDELSERFPLWRDYLGRAFEIGHLTISVSRGSLRRAVAERAWMVLLTNVALVAGILAILYWQVHVLLTAPLIRMAHIARDQRGRDPGHPTALTLPPDMANDELYDLAGAYRDTHRDLQSNYLALKENEARLRILFDQSPVSLWEEDFSQVKSYLDQLRTVRTQDLADYLRTHPGVVADCAALVRVIDVNAATLVLHGAASQDALLGNLDKTLTPGSLDAFSRQLLAIWHGEAKIEVEGEVAALNGERRDVVVHWAVPPGHGERLDRVIVALENVTERKAAERTLSDTIATLRRTNAELERFTEIASHDLQEPVRSIVSFSQLLERRLQDGLDQESRELLGFLMVAARRMQAQTRGLLEYSRIGALGGVTEAVDLNPVVESALAALSRPVAEAKAVVRVGPLPRVSGNAVLLAELFRQVLDNAIKFTLPGVPPTIEVSGTVEDGIAQVSVTDNGIGIAPAYAEDVFQIFRRLHGPDHYSGAGIGLAICRKIADRLGGRIWVDTGRHDGCSIHLAIPALTVAP